MKIPEEKVVTATTYAPWALLKTSKESNKLDTHSNSRIHEQPMVIKKVISTICNLQVTTILNRANALTLIFFFFANLLRLAGCYKSISRNPMPLLRKTFGIIMGDTVKIKVQVWTVFASAKHRISTSATTIRRVPVNEWHYHNCIDATSNVQQHKQWWHCHGKFEYCVDMNSKTLSVSYTCIFSPIPTNILKNSSN